MSDGKTMFGTTPGSGTDIQLRIEGGTVWLVQGKIADLFATTKQNVSRRLRNLLHVNDLMDISGVKERAPTAADGVLDPHNTHNRNIMHIGIPGRDACRTLCINGILFNSGKKSCV